MKDIGLEETLVNTLISWIRGFKEKRISARKNKRPQTKVSLIRPTDG